MFQADSVNALSRRGERFGLERAAITVGRTDRIEESVQQKILSVQPVAGLGII